MFSGISSTALCTSMHLTERKMLFQFHLTRGKIRGRFSTGSHSEAHQLFEILQIPVIQNKHQAH